MTGNEEATVLEGSGVVAVENPRWKEGMGTSIQAGLAAIEPMAVDGVILVLGDQPMVSADAINRLIRIHEQTGKPVVSAEYAGTVGVPVLFAKTRFGDLYSLDPDQGCKGVIVKYRAEAETMPCPEALIRSPIS